MLPYALLHWAEQKLPILHPGCERDGSSVSNNTMGKGYSPVAGLPTLPGCLKRFGHMLMGCKTVSESVFVFIVVDFVVGFLFVLFLVGYFFLFLFLFPDGERERERERAESESIEERSKM